MDPPVCWLIAKVWRLSAKRAVSIRSWSMRTVVDEADGSLVPSPDHPPKEYPVLGVALIVGLLP